MKLIYGCSFIYKQTISTIICGVGALIISLSFISTVQGQNSSRLYVSVLQRNNFVVGMKASSSGLFSLEQDTSWAHYGWNKNRLNGISYDPANTRHMFMACGNGVFRTTNGGKSWNLTTGWRITEVQDISVDPFHPDTTFIASAYGVWKTFNNGASWDWASTGLNHSYKGAVPNQFFVQTIEIDQKHGQYILVGGEGGIHRSTDAAKHWEKTGPKNVAIRDIRQSSIDPDVWIAGTEDQGILLSHDAGQTWKHAKGSISKETIYAVAINPQNLEIMAAAGYQTGVYFSLDGGETWKQHTKGLPILNFHGLAFDPAHPNRLWAGSVGKGVFLSDDKGTTWHYKGLYNAEVSDMTFLGGTR